MAEPTQVKDIVEEKKECKYKDCDGLIDDYKCDKCGKAPMGGKRPGAGRPEGRLDDKTLEQKKIQEKVNQRILRHADKLFNAAMSLAVGTQKLIVIISEGEGKNKKRRHEIVDDEEIIKQYLDYNEGINDTESPNDENHYYYLTTEKPDIRAIDSLMNRGLGKAPERLEIHGEFFNRNELTIKVVGDRHDFIDISNDGQISERSEESGANSEQHSESSDKDSESPASN